MKRRSNAQSKYRFYVIELLKTEFKKKGFNYSTDQMNDLLKYKTGFYIETIKDPFGDEIVRYLPTNKYSVAVFEAWLEAIRSWGDEIGIDIPPPNCPTLEELMKGE